MHSSIEPLSIAIALFTLAFSGVSHAQDISHAIRNNSQNDTTSENYFELGIGATWRKGPASIVRTDETWVGGYGIINFSYNYKGFFVERFADKFTDSTDPYVVGYNAYNWDNWSLDIIGSRKNDRVHIKGWVKFVEPDDSFEFRDVSVIDKKADFVVGGRLTGYFGQNILQFTAGRDIRGHHGNMASALIGRNWQLRNWNVHGLLGVQYTDATTNDYYKGITANESQLSGLSQYQADGGFNFNAEVGVTYPITQDWVYRATAGVVSLSDEASQSPLYSSDRSTAITFSTSISYVF